MTTFVVLGTILVTAVLMLIASLVARKLVASNRRSQKVLATAPVVGGRRRRFENEVFDKLATSMVRDIGSNVHAVQILLDRIFAIGVRRRLELIAPSIALDQLATLTSDIELSLSKVKNHALEELGRIQDPRAAQQFWSEFAGEFWADFAEGLRRPDWARKIEEWYGDASLMKDAPEQFLLQLIRSEVEAIINEMPDESPEDSLVSG